MVLLLPRGRSIIETLMFSPTAFGRGMTSIANSDDRAQELHVKYEEHKVVEEDCLCIFGS